MAKSALLADPLADELRLGEQQLGTTTPAADPLAAELQLGGAAFGTAPPPDKAPGEVDWSRGLQAGAAAILPEARKRQFITDYVKKIAPQRTPTTAPVWVDRDGGGKLGMRIGERRYDVDPAWEREAGQEWEQKRWRETHPMRAKWSDEQGNPRPIDIGDYYWRFLEGPQKLPGVGQLISLEQALDVDAIAKLMQEHPTADSWRAHRRKLLEARKQKREGRAPTAEEYQRSDVWAQELYNKEVNRLTQYLMKKEELAFRGTTIAADVLEGASELPAYMVDFLVTNGVANLGSEAARSAATRLLGRYAKMQGISLLVKGVGWVGGAATRTVFMPGRVASGTAERMLPGLSLDENGAVVINPKEGQGAAEAFFNAFADVLLENMSEVAGEGMGQATAWAAERIPGIRRVAPVVARALRAVTPKGMEKLGFHGLISEIGEERLREALGIAYEELTGKKLQRGTDQKFTTSGRQLLTEFLVLLAPTAAGKVGEFAARRVAPAAPREGFRPKGESDALLDIPTYDPTAQAGAESAAFGSTVGAKTAQERMAEKIGVPPSALTDAELTSELSRRGLPRDGTRADREAALRGAIDAEGRGAKTAAGVRLRNDAEAENRETEPAEPAQP
ncbi:MAG TPA: hypothetical protein VM487_20525, partial [Phycisphaerae bacterium]|nr:hypothetical protein [Phycisphaerae bacterium]